MRVVVLVKHVPDAAYDRRLTAAGTLDRGGPGLLSELDEYPLAAARALAEAGLADEVVAVTMGPADADEALRRALQLGADRAVHVLDERLAGADAGATSLVLAAAVRAAGPDLVLAGAASADAGTGLVPAQVAAALGLPALLGASDVAVAGGLVTVHREDESERLTLEAALPALVSVTDRAEPARYPTAREVFAARRKPVDVVDLDALGLEPPAARTAVERIAAAPPRAAGRVVHDDGTAGALLAEVLRAALPDRAATAPPAAGRPAGAEAARTAGGGPAATRPADAHPVGDEPVRAEGDEPAPADLPAAPRRDVLVLVDHDRGLPRPAAAAHLAAAAELGRPVAVLADERPATPDALAALAAAGAEVVVSAPGAGWSPATGAPRLAALLAGLARDRGAAAVLLPDGPDATHVAALLGPALGTGVVTGAHSVDAAGRAVKDVLGGEATTTVRAAGPLVATLTAHPAAAPVAAAARTEHLVVPLPGGDDRVRLVGRAPLPPSGRPRLADAQVVVAAGRGLAGDLRPVEDLADALGAAVAGSRAAVDAGWLPHSAQVGQTGATIAPRVYVAAGISGAVQHLAGIRGARTVVAVTTDPDAPILAVADLGIVGDAFTVLPRATAALLEGGTRG